MLKIDWVFFAGSSQNCLLVSRQLNEILRIQPVKPKILMSNACVSRQLLLQGGADISEAYLTHHMLATEFNNDGYGYRGKQAFRLLQEIIEDADSNYEELTTRNSDLYYYVRVLLGWHRTADARNALSALMENAVNSEKQFLLEKDEYSFNRNGTIKETTFHVWQVKTLSNVAKFEDIEDIEDIENIGESAR